MYDIIQTALTATAEAIAFIAIVGLPVHYIIMGHVREVRSWGTPQPIPAKKIEVKQETKVIATKQLEVKPEVERVTEVIPTVDVVKKPSQAKLQPMSVGAAAINYAEMTSEQLRKECALQGINWRSGGDYARSMKKVQMLAALR